MPKIGKGTIMRWSKPEVQAHQRALLSSLSVPFGSMKQRLQHILQELAHVEKAGRFDADLLLRHFLLAVSTIVHVGRHGGLTTKQCEELFETAEGILRLQEIEPSDRNLGFMHFDLCTAMSTVHRRKGDTWRSSWLYWHGAENHHPQTPEEQAHHHMIRGQRLMRLNHLVKASEEMQAALDIHPKMDLTPRMVCWIQIGRCLRLQGQRSEALSWLSDGQATCPTHLQVELNWEIAILNAIKMKECRNLVTLAATDAYRAKIEYAVEAKIWVLNTPNRRLIQKAKSMKQSSRDFGPATKKMGAFFAAALSLENCYDATISMSIRKRDLCQALEGRPQYGTVEKELLVLGAAARFLSQEQSWPLLELVLLEYQKLALQTTGTRSVDPIGFIGDILAQCSGQS